MKIDEIIKSARWFDLVYKNSFNIGQEYKGWENLQELVKHKRGRKPEGYRFYTKDGIYVFYVENNGKTRSRKQTKLS